MNEILWGLQLAFVPLGGGSSSIENNLARIAAPLRPVARVPFIARAGQKAPGFQRQPTEISDRSILRRGQTLHHLPANWLLAWIVSRVHVIYIVRSYAVELKNGFTLDAVIVR